MFTTILVRPLFNLLATIYAYLPIHDFGLAIILLTVVVRLILWPLVSKQLHSQKAMQELQPELARIRREAKGDKAVEGKLTMELYKEKEINPLASFLPLIIQLPIFFALYAVLRDVVKPGEIAHLAYGPVQHFGPIAEIIKHGNAFHPTLLGVIDLAKASPLIALLAGIGQFVQTRQLMPKNQVKDPTAAMISNMTIYAFPALTFIIGLSLPAALALYWTTTAGMAILQQTIVLRQDVRELEAEPSLPETTTPAANKPSKKAKRKAKGSKA